MNRTLTAAVALAVAFGMAGLAQAQTSSTSPMTTSPSASQPGMSGTQNPAATTAPGSTSTSPQANTNQMNMAPRGGATQPASQSQIQQAQEQLKSAGLYRGSVDGVMGPETQTALMKFQREQGLPETAQLDQQTMDRLSSGSSGGSATSPNAPPHSGATPGMTPNSTTGGSSSPAPSNGGSYNR